MFKIRHKGAGVLLGKAGRVWDDGTGHVVGEKLLEEIILISDPPSGNCRIMNVYWSPQLERAVFEYEDTPMP